MVDENTIEGATAETVEAGVAVENNGLADPVITTPVGDQLAPKFLVAAVGENDQSFHNLKDAHESAQSAARNNPGITFTVLESRYEVSTPVPGLVEKEFVNT